MDIQPITKADAIAAFDGNASALARALKVTPSAIYQWPDGPIAEGYALKLTFVLKPAEYGAESTRPSPVQVTDGRSAEVVPAVPMSRVA